MATLIDTDILSLFFRNDTIVVARFASYARQHDVIHISIVTYYEILSGLMHRDARKQLERFLEFSRRNVIVPLTQAAADESSRLYAVTRRAGKPVDDIDLLIAGTAIANDMHLATHNLAHFGKLPGLIAEDWATD